MWVSMMTHSRGPAIIYLILLIALAVTLVPQTFASTVANYGDQNIEQWSSTIGADMVQAYVLFTVPGPVVIQSISMYMQYSGSDGSQCMRFGIYQDNGNGSPAGQPLIASRQTAIVSMAELPGALVGKLGSFVQTIPSASPLPAAIGLQRWLRKPTATFTTMRTAQATTTHTHM